MTIKTTKEFSAFHRVLVVALLSASLAGCGSGSPPPQPQRNDGASVTTSDGAGTTQAKNKEGQAAVSSQLKEDLENLVKEIEQAEKELSKIHEEIRPLVKKYSLVQQQRGDIGPLYVELYGTEGKQGKFPEYYYYAYNQIKNINSKYDSLKKGLAQTNVNKNTLKNIDNRIKDLFTPLHNFISFSKIKELQIILFDKQYATTTDAQTQEDFADGQYGWSTQTALNKMLEEKLSNIKTDMNTLIQELKPAEIKTSPEPSPMPSPQEEHDNANNRTIQSVLILLVIVFILALVFGFKKGLFRQLLERKNGSSSSSSKKRRNARRQPQGDRVQRQPGEEGSTVLTENSTREPSISQNLSPNWHQVVTHQIQSSKPVLDRSPTSTNTNTDLLPEVLKKLGGLESAVQQLNQQRGQHRDELFSQINQLQLSSNYNSSPLFQVFQQKIEIFQQKIENVRNEIIEELQRYQTTSYPDNELNAVADDQEKENLQAENANLKRENNDLAKEKIRLEGELTSYSAKQGENEARLNQSDSQIRILQKDKQKLLQYIERLETELNSVKNEREQIEVSHPRTPVVHDSQENSLEQLLLDLVNSSTSDLSARELERTFQQKFPQIKMVAKDVRESDNSSKARRNDGAKEVLLSPQPRGAGEFLVVENQQSQKAFLIPISQKISDANQMTAQALFFDFQKGSQEKFTLKKPAQVSRKGENWVLTEPGEVSYS